ncbi:MAG: hypothetical protein ACRC4W_00075 [Treponemataceae bacterium]
MKRFILLVVFALLCSVSFSYEYDARRHEKSTTRANGMGKHFSADISTFYTLFSNPAGMPLLGNIPLNSIQGELNRLNEMLNQPSLSKQDIKKIKKQISYLQYPGKLFPSLELNLGGPLQDLIGINFLSKNLFNDLADLVSKNNGVNLDVNLNLIPLQAGSIERNVFGSTNNAFGWALLNNTYVSANIPALNFSDIRIGNEISTQVSYGHVLINQDNHMLSVGGGLKLFIQTEFLIEDSITDLVSNFSFSNLPFLVNVGFGLDAGVLYSWANLLKVSVMAYDIYTPLFVNEISGSGARKKYHVMPFDLTVGFGINIPIAWSAKVLSSWQVLFDYSNIIQSFMPLERNPILNLAVGTEVVFINMIALRVGISEMYLHAGLGLKFGTFRIDVAAYGRELGKEPGSRPQFNVDFSFAFYR